MNAMAHPGIPCDAAQTAGEQFFREREEIEREREVVEREREKNGRECVREREEGSQTKQNSKLSKV